MPVQDSLNDIAVANKFSEIYPLRRSPTRDEEEKEGGV